jgi:hypothetical protein
MKGIRKFIKCFLSFGINCKYIRKAKMKRQMNINNNIHRSFHKLLDV